MTLAAPRSRQGKLTLVLAILVVAAAAVGTFFWANSAQADISTTTVVQASNQGPTANPGDTITYTFTVTQVGIPGGVNGGARFDVTLDSANIGAVTFPAANNADTAPWLAFECSYAAPVATCLTTIVPPNDYMDSDVVTIDVVVAPGGDNDVDPPTTCFVSDNGTGQANCTGTIATLTIAPGVTITPAAPTNVVGQAEVFTIHFEAGVTCASDVNNDANRDCAAGDLLISGTAAGTATVTGWPPAVSLLNAVANVTVTVSNTAAGTVILTLANRYEGDIATDTDDVALAAAVATKTFQTLATAGDAHLVHVDVDDATEDTAAETPRDLDAAAPQRGGVLTIQDDNDDATGSLHTVCLISAALGAADQGNITWNIAPPTLPAASDGQLVDALFNDVKVSVNVQADGTVNDDADANCIEWRSAGVGSQNITATYAPTAEIVGWDDADADGSGIGDPPLIKQWNDIDETKIIQTTGDVGDTLPANTSGLAGWGNRDCTSRTTEACAGFDRDGTVVTINGTQIINGNGLIRAGSTAFIDYTFGDHSNYDGPVDGAQQTYTVTGTCGTVRLENPVTGAVIILDNDTSVATGATFPGSAIILNSDKGVGFQVLPNRDGDEETTLNNADCYDGESLTVTITTREDVQIRSDLDTALSETVTVRWTAGPGPEKQPMLAWVGQRVVLAKDWTDPATGECPWAGDPGEPETFYVRYLIQAPSPGALSNVPGAPVAVATGPDYIVVPVEQTPDPGVECISNVIYESQNQGRVDVTAHVVSQPTLQPASDYSVISPEYDFWYYYMKFESLTLTSSATSSIVSSDVTLTAVVKGWVLADNCPVKAAGEDENGLLLPANRCTFPDDWAQVVGDDEQFDILGGSSSCIPVGPFSLLDSVPPADCTDPSSAPMVGGGVRNTVDSGGGVTALDAPMPPAEITFDLDGAGFLQGVDKPASAGDYQSTHIPAEPQILTAGSGYLWHTWTGTGARSGLYNFWTDFIGVGDEIVSCPGDSVGDSPESCVGGVPTGGFNMTKVYSDNRGVAEAEVNGDANLAFTGCDNNLSDHKIISPIIGHYCESGDVVGTSTISANADYPDKKPHRDVDAPDPVTITWTWGGVKDITTAPGETLGPDKISTYVIFNVTDRDGFCAPSDSLHPVLGERVEFLIDSGKGEGTIIEAASLGSIAGDGLSATTFTFDTDAPETRTKGSPPADTCQAWVLVSHSNNDPVDIRVKAFDPEGTITFDTILNPTPPPTPEPTDEPPFSYSRVWGDSDCNGSIAPRDGQSILRYFLDQSLLTQTTPCPALGEHVTIGGNDQIWGDWDCNDAVAPRDGQIDLKKFLTQTPPAAIGSPCPTVGDSVNVEPILP